MKGHPVIFVLYMFIINSLTIYLAANINPSELLLTTNLLTTLATTTSNSTSMGDGRQ